MKYPEMTRTDCYVNMDGELITPENMTWLEDDETACYARYSIGPEESVWLNMFDEEVDIDTEHEMQYERWSQSQYG